MFRRLLIISLCVTWLTACEDAKPRRSRPNAPAATAQAAPTPPPAEGIGAAPTSEEVEAGLEYAYSPVGKRDPFRSFLIDEANAAAQKAAAPARPVENLRCGPLCKWDLEQLRLVAIVSGVSSPIAMVESPDGNGYMVRRGAFIGKRNGKVTNIRPGEMVVTEIYKDNAGVPQPHEIAIPLSKSPTDQVDLEGENNLMNAGIEQ